MGATDHENSDHRTNRRVLIDLKVHLKIGDEPEQTLFSHDWSRKGVFLRARKSYPPGTKATIGVLVPSEHELVWFPAVVIRSLQETGDPQLRPPGVGLYFDTLPASLALYLSQMSYAAKLGAEDARESGLHDVVLLVGDTGAERLQLSVYLDDKGIDVAEASDPEQADDLLIGGLKPDAAVIFLEHFNRNFEQLLDRLHDLSGGRLRCVIVVDGDEKDSSIALRHHASFFIRRPVTPERIYALLAGPKQSSNT